MTLPNGTILDGSYRIERAIARSGFALTYEAEDIELSSKVAIKEFYPLEHAVGLVDTRAGSRSGSADDILDWGRSNFLQEARTLARFEHPSIVRVTRVFEQNSTAYMVMRFEDARSLEDWLINLDRAPSQQEMDAIVTPLLGALALLHEQNFVHRGISPRTILVRDDLSPVLDGFEAARRISPGRDEPIAGIVTEGYSPHEQYANHSRLQGPWTDVYALGGTLYRAVTGRVPDQATLRFDDDPMPRAAQAAKGSYRPDFLTAIDACLMVRMRDRPQSIAALRPMLLGPAQE